MPEQTFTYINKSTSKMEGLQSCNVMWDGAFSFGNVIQATVHACLHFRLPACLPGMHVHSLRYTLSCTNSSTEPGKHVDKHDYIRAHTHAQFMLIDADGDNFICLRDIDEIWQWSSVR
jgi:hypothetical protein